MSTDKLVYKDIIVFDDQWKIVGWHYAKTNRDWTGIKCPCRILLASNLHISRDHDYSKCKLHPTIPDIVSITYNIIK